MPVRPGPSAEQDASTLRDPAYAGNTAFVSHGPALHSLFWDIARGMRKTSYERSLDCDIGTANPVGVFRAAAGQTARLRWATEMTIECQDVFTLNLPEALDPADWVYDPWGGRPTSFCCVWERR